MHRIYYISQGSSQKDHLNNIASVCEAGCRLVQLRLKGLSWEEQLETGKAAKAICDSYESVFIVNDSVKLALAVGASGVHLGKKDMPPQEARKVLPNHMLIGATANTLEDCIQSATQKVDYIGLGPYRFTQTKEQLSPILGIEGIRKILETLRDRGIALPIYAIGGIVASDFRPLFEAGIEGIAASGLLSGKEKEKLEILLKEANLIKNSEFRLQRNE